VFIESTVVSLYIDSVQKRFSQKDGAH